MLTFGRATMAGVAFGGLEAGSGGSGRQEQGVVGEVLEDGGLDGVLVDPRGAGGLGLVRAVGFRLLGGIAVVC